MAQRFLFETIYDQENWTMITENAGGIEERFYAAVHNEIQDSKFPNLDVSIDEYVTGGIVFGRENTKMLRMRAKGSKFKGFEVYYRAQAFGNVVLFTRFECMEATFGNLLSAAAGQTPRNVFRSKCKNMAQWEEFIAIDSVADLFFYRAIQKIDPDYREKRLMNSVVSPAG